MSETRPGSPALLPLVVRSVALIGAAMVAHGARRAGATLAGYLAVALLLAVSAGFFTLSGYRALALALGDIYASLLVGGSYLVMALLAIIVLLAHRR